MKFVMMGLGLFLSASAFADSGILTCKYFAASHAVVMEVLALDCEDEAGDQFKITIPSEGWGFKFAVGVWPDKAAMRVGVASISYTGFGNFEGDFYGPNVTAGGVVGADVAIVSNGRMIAVLTGLEAVVGGGVTINKFVAERVTRPLAAQTESPNAESDLRFE
jgi:hypothetical protein